MRPVQFVALAGILAAVGCSDRGVPMAAPAPVTLKVVGPTGQPVKDMIGNFVPHTASQMPSQVMLTGGQVTKTKSGEDLALVPGKYNLRLETVSDDARHQTAAKGIPEKYLKSGVELEIKPGEPNNLEVKLEGK